MCTIACAIKQPLFVCKSLSEATMSMQLSTMTSHTMTYVSIVNIIVTGSNENVGRAHHIVPCCRQYRSSWL